MNIKQIVEDTMSAKGIPYKSFDTGRLKCKPGNVTWSTPSQDDTKDSSIRVVKLENNTPMNGEGKIMIQKENKPLCEFQLTEGVLEGYMQRVIFQGPVIKGSPLPQFIAPVHTRKSSVIDYIGLTLETSVPVAGGETKYAEVKNSTQVFKAQFFCEARVNGKIVVVKMDDGTVDILQNRTVKMKGTLTINFQNNQEIKIN